jgi:hypothetical protein
MSEMVAQADEYEAFADSMVGLHSAPQRGLNSHL